MKRQWLLFFILLFLVMCFSDFLLGMPAFARKYKMSCNVCHSPFPKLKEYGEEFAGNGFVLKDKDSPRYFRDTGDDKLSLVKEIPIALRMEGHFYYNNSHSQQVDFASPYLVKLLSGGTLAKKISYYFYFFMNERGKVAGLEDAFIFFNDIFGTGLALAVGQFQVSDPLFKRELRLTFEDYMIYKGKPPFSSIDLTYDRGLMFSYGIARGPDFTFEILNGSGIEEADGLKNFDTDKYKNIFGRVSQGFGEHLRIGACGYYGNEIQYGEINRAQIWGVDATLHFDILELNLQYIDRSDNNAQFALAPGIEENIRGGFAEVIFTPRGDKSAWYAVGLFNWIEADYPGLDYRSISGHVGYLLRRNFRLVAEINHIFKSHEGEYTRAGIGLITAF